MFVSNLDEVRNEFVQRMLGIKMVYRFLIAPNTDHILAIKRVVSSPNADNMPALQLPMRPILVLRFAEVLIAVIHSTTNQITYEKTPVY